MHGVCWCSGASGTMEVGVVWCVHCGGLLFVAGSDGAVYSVCVGKVLSC